MGEKIGLIAGNGKFPLLFAQAASKEGYEVIAIAHKGETEPDLEKYVNQIEWIKVGQLGKLIKTFKKAEVKDVVLAGGITKRRLFTEIFPDLKALSLLTKLKNKSDDAALRAIAKELEKEGLIVRPSTLFISSLIAPAGCLTKRKPDREEEKDIRFGWKIAKEIGRLDIGQCVVVKKQTVVAVEAIEGTDEAIRRGGRLAKEGAVVIKVSKPQQDLRFDVPAVGLGTIKTMAEVKANVLAIEAERTLIFDKEEMLATANEVGISVVSLESVDR
ncbi:MAG: UDP-2,3-diacylglucosamine diphosphatase LpxI [Candidatus Desulfofervidaceae bacterium]|nr:UDP-2,3-diacylglucosamine diphosphatase LpxI [Candidatus Desulfofervidaceae bacterium]